MILSILLNLILTFITFILGILPDLPDMPEQLINSVNVALDFIFGNLNILGVFIRPTTIQIAMPVFIAIVTFDKIWIILKFILKKIPFIHWHD